MDIVSTSLRLLAFACAVTTGVYVVSRWDRFMEFASKPVEKRSTAGKAALVVVLGAAIMVASRGIATVDIAGAPVNLRDAVSFFAAALGGPVVGAVVGLIGGAYRFSMGGWTGLACGIGTGFSGIFAGLLVYYFGFDISEDLLDNTKRMGYYILALGAYETFHILVLVPIFGGRSAGPDTLMGAFQAMFPKVYLPMTAINMVMLTIVMAVARDRIQEKKRMDQLEAQKNALEEQLEEE